MKKYELTNETIIVHGHTLHRIRALRDFNDVKAGELGGFIEKEKNLSHEGNCWIYDDSMAFEQSKIYDNAQIKTGSEIYGNAKVYGNAILDFCIVRDYAQIYGQVCTFNEIFDGVDIIYNNITLQKKESEQNDDFNLNDFIFFL